MKQTRLNNEKKSAILWEIRDISVCLKNAYIILIFNYNEYLDDEKISFSFTYISV